LIKVKSANFIKSASKIGEAPNSNKKEIAILGRSNVGKSSTINSLTNRKGLAKSSNTPGKTKLINFFDVQFSNGESEKGFTLVDLPGVGYAKVSKTQKREWEGELLKFIENREAITLFIYLVDARHTNLDIDIGVIEYLNGIGKEVLIVYTKIDKLKKSDLHKLKSQKRDSILISNSNKVGIDLLREVIWDRV